MSVPVSRLALSATPLVDKVRSSKPVGELRQLLDIKLDTKVVGLFPGSRNSEITWLLPLMFETAHFMQQRNSALQFIMPIANTLDYNAIAEQSRQSGLDIMLTRDDIYDVIPCCDAIVSCSGTVTLEIALLEIPMCIVYKMTWLSYQIMSRLINIPNIGLANIVANRRVVREFLQDEATAKNISTEIFKILDDDEYRGQVIQDLSEVKANLGEGDGAGNMARLVVSFVDNNK